MAKKKKEAGAVTESKFTVPAFRYNGVEYKSADVEKAVESGDEDAKAILANLIKKQSGVVAIIAITEEGGSDE